MEGIFLQILNMSITAGWVILAVIAGRFFLKRAPRKYTVLLWGLVALRLILPFSIESPTSLVPSAETIRLSIEYAERPQIQSGIPVLNETVNPVIGEMLTPSPESSVNPMQVLTFVGRNLWILGMAVMLVFAFAGFLRLRRKTREAVRLRENIWICDQVETPFVLGNLRPRIYLPSGFVIMGSGKAPDGSHDKTRISADGFEAVLAHERAHISRKDPLWKALGFLLLTVYWFHPLVWVAYILFCRDIETACDEKVIRDMNMAGRKSYARALVTCGRQQKVMLVCPLAFGEVGVKERVKGVLNYKKPGFWIVIAAFAVCAVVAVCFATNPVKKEETPSVRILKVKMEDLKGVVTAVRENGYTASMWLADGMEETKVGHMYEFQLEEYLANAEWEACGPEKCLTDEEHLLLSNEKFSLAVYKDLQFACLQMDGQTKSYQIGAKDYETLREMFHPYSEENAAAVSHDYVELYAPYVGDASKVSRIAGALPYPDGYSYNSIKIWSQTEPYGLDVYLNGPFDPNNGERFTEALTNAFRTCAEVAFASIGNLGSIRFYAVDEYEQKWSLYSSSRKAEETPEGKFAFGEQRGSVLTLSKDGQYGRFTFSYDVLSSYLPIGTAVRSGDRIVCRTDDGAFQYTFTIKDENTLIFDAKNSSVIEYIDQQVSFDRPVEDGSTFLRFE